MSNVYTMVPKKPAQYNLVTKQERLVYVPLATRETAGIVRIGEGLSVSGGLLVVHPDVLKQIDDNKHLSDDLVLDLTTITSRVDALELEDININKNIEDLVTETTRLESDKVNKSYYKADNISLKSHQISNDETSLSLSSSHGTAGINYSRQNINRLNMTDGSFSAEQRESSSGSLEMLKSELRFSKDGTQIKLNYNKVYNDDGYNGEVATRPYVDAKEEGFKSYVDNKISQVKTSVGYVFDTFEHFEKWITGDYIRYDSVLVSSINVGDDIFIIEEGIPDYWVKSKSTPMTLDDFEPYESGDYKPTVIKLED